MEDNSNWTWEQWCEYSSAEELAAAVAASLGDNEYCDAEPEIRTFLLGVAWGRNNPK